MQIRILDIPDEGLQLLDPAALGSVYPDPAWTLDAVELLVERRGEKVAIAGRFEATAHLLCGRCLDPIEARVEPTVDLQLVPQPSGRQSQVELGRDDLEVDFYQGDVLDVGALLRSETDLALPMKPLCRPDCRGLCPVCGGNKNVTECRCETRGVDPRLAPLEALRRLQ
ncbi:MAG TPA: DUF177 domain-containing protein [Methylomirabilota bacterium]|jgi:uncharacterized protein